MVRYFAADLIRRIRPSAIQAATLSGLNRNTVNRFYRGLQERILLDCEARRPLFGVVEVDESFFGARRVKGGRGLGKTQYLIADRQHILTQVDIARENVV